VVETGDTLMGISFGKEETARRQKVPCKNSIYVHLCKSPGAYFWINFIKGVGILMRTP
jgi:hypothetical protein